MDYEWDEEKRQANLAKHKIDFADIGSFDWNNSIEREDFSDPGENRWRATGELFGRVVNVIYTMRGDKIRVISIFAATPKERRNYYNG